MTMSWDLMNLEVQMISMSRHWKNVSPGMSHFLTLHETTFVCVGMALFLWMKCQRLSRVKSLLYRKDSLFRRHNLMKTQISMTEMLSLFFIAVQGYYSVLDLADGLGIVVKSGLTGPIGWPG